MNKLLQGLSLVWILILPTIAVAHDGHGLIGDVHYHAPVNLELLGGLIIAGLIVVALKAFVTGRKKR